MLLQKWLLTVSPATTPPVPPGPGLSPGPLFAYGLNASGQLGNNTTVTQTSSPIQIGTSSWTTVATGYSTTVGLRSDGTVWTWGNNTFGQLGNNDTTLIHRSSPIQVGTSSWTAIAAKGDTYYGIQANGLLYAWGVGTYGGIGNNSSLTVNSPSYSYTSIGGSFTHKLMRTTIGGLYAMGDNGYGQFGNGITSGGIYSPVQVAADKSWTSVSAGNSYSEFIDSDGRLYAAGWNNAYGNLGDGTIINKSSPVQIGSNPNMKGTSWVQVIAGIDNITAALATNPPRSLWLWGNNTNGALGTNARIHRSTPFMISTITTPDQQSAYATQTGLTIPSWRTISSGFNNSIAIKSDYTVWVWGVNTAGQLGLDDIINRSSPVQLGTGSWLGVASGQSHMVGIQLDGSLWSWGNNSFGALGLNDTNIHRSSPVQIASGNWTKVNAGSAYTGAIRSDGTLWMWGSASNGQLGNSSTIARSSPVQVAGSWSQIILAVFASMAIQPNGTLWTWGLNGDGQLGDGTRVSKSSPAQTSAGGSWIMATVGTNYAAGIRTDGTLWTWGYNSSGELGSNNRIGRSVPQQVGTSSWTFIKANRNVVSGTYMNGITTSGALFGWGNNISWNIPEGTTTGYRSSPIQIGTSSWSFLGDNSNACFGATINNVTFTWGSGGSGANGLDTAGNGSSRPVFLRSLTDSWDDVKVTSHVVALRKGGNLYAWGFNAQGQLGDGTQINRSSPIQVGTSSWSQIATGVLNSYGLLNNNLYSWGDNSYGQIGDNTTATYLSPVQIGTSSWTTINAGYYTAYATDTSNKLFAWGYGGDGSIGNNTAINYSSPVQIGTNNWDAKNINSWQGTLGIDNFGILYTWGYNQNGLIGRFFNPDSPTGSPYVNTSSPVQLGSVSYFISPTQVGSGSWSQVSTGFSHVIGTRSDGSLYGWGNNSNGQLGVSNFTPKSSPVLIDSGNWTSISTSTEKFSLGVKNSELYGWGVADPTNYYYPAPQLYSWTQVSVGGINYSRNDYITVAAIRSDGILFTWGYNASGQLGIDDTINRSSPVQIGTSSWTSVSTSNNNIAAIKSDGTLWIWGNGSFGALGQDNTVSKSSPTQVGTGSWNQVSLDASFGNEAVIATAVDNKLYGWGFNNNGQLGLNDTVHRSSPVQIGAGTNWTYANVGGGTGFAIQSTGALFGWGNNTYGQLGDNTIISKSSPVAIGTSSWTMVKTNKAYWSVYGAQYNDNNSTAGITTNGRLFTWGNNSVGQLALNDTVQRSSPVQVGTSSWTQVSVGNNSLRAINTLGQLFSVGGTGTFWVRSINTLNPGFSTTGELATSNFNSSPVQVGTTSWTQIVQGGGAGMIAGISNTNKLYLWGTNFAGAIGNNTLGPSNIPTQPIYMVPKPTKYTSSISWTQVSAGVSHGMALSADNKLYAWGAAGAVPYSLSTSNSIVQIGTTTGFNFFVITKLGNLYTWGAIPFRNQYNAVNVGINNTQYAPSSTPGSGIDPAYMLPTITGNVTWSWKAVASSTTNTFAIRSDDTLYVVGNGANGQLGNNSTAVNINPLFEQHGNRTWNSIAWDDGTATGITKTDNYLWAWGDNSYGQIANGSFDLTAKSSPVQVSSLLNNVAEASWQTSNPSMPYWTSLNLNGGQGSALRSDGAIFTWGFNSSGTLGDGTTIHRSSPVQIGTSSWSMINTQGNVTSAIRTDGMLFTWGQNGNGNLALSDRVSRSSPVQVGTSSWLMVRASNFGSAGILSTGALYTWGNNTFGVLGNSSQVPRSSPVQLGTSSWSFIEVSDVSPLVAAITSNKRLFTWGLNTSGQLGDGTILSRSSPVQIGTSSWNQVSLGGISGGAVRSDGMLFTWGSDSAGALGFNTRSVNKSSPVQIGTSSWSQVSVGTDFMTAIKTDGTLYSWGSNSRGNLGSDNSAGRSSPVQVGTSSWSMINNGANSNSGLTNKSAFLWGLGGGNGAFPMISMSTGAVSNYRSSPVFLKTASIPDTFTKAGSFGGMIAAIRSDGLLFAWGRGDSGQLGNNTVNNANGNVVQIGNSSWTSLNTSSNGSNTMFAIRADGALFAWGGNGYGMSGDAIGVAMSSPVQITSIWTESALNSYTANTGATFPTSWTKISLGSGASAAIDSNGKLYMWGDNTYGQLGDNTIISQVQPKQIGNSSWTQVSTNICNGDMDAPGTFYSTMAIKSDGTLWVWGSNSFGHLGDNTIIDRSSPVQIGTSSWSQISTANTAFAAIRLDNTLWTWGHNVYGNLGTNNTVDRSSPVQVGTSSWSAISLGLTMSLGILSTGKLFSWGANSSPYVSPKGQLGQNDTVHRSSPTQIGTFDYTTASASSGDTYRGFAAALTTTGSLFTWGDNTYGELGNPGSYVLSPVQIGTTSWTNLNVAGFTVFAKTVSGVQFGWGNNYNGQLGNGTNTSYGSPVQITSRAWNSLTAGPYATFWFGSSGVIYGSGNNSILPMNSTNQTSPIFINTGQYDSWTMAATSDNADYFSLMIRKDNVLFAAGRNDSGQLGIGTTTPSSTAVPQSPLIGTVSHIMVVSGNPVALGTDGILYTWAKIDRSLQTIRRSAPTQVTNPLLYGISANPIPVQVGTSSWNFVAAGNGQTYAVNATNALYQWNFNSNQQLNYSIISSPTLVGISAYSMTVGPNNINIIKKN